jgi:hypothetical protein
LEGDVGLLEFDIGVERGIGNAVGFGFQSGRIERGLPSLRNPTTRSTLMKTI